MTERRRTKRRPHISPAACGLDGRGRVVIVLSAGSRVDLVATLGRRDAARLHAALGDALRSARDDEPPTPTQPGGSS